jgi:hypothetical protein
MVPDVSEERVTFMDLENEGDTFVRRAGNHLSSEATHLGRQESSTTKYSTGATEVQHKENSSRPSKNA